MTTKFSNTKKPAEQVLKDIRRATRRHFSADDKIRIVLDGLRGEGSIDVDDPAGVLLRTGYWTHLNLPAIALRDRTYALMNGRSHRRFTG